MPSLQKMKQTTGKPLPHIGNLVRQVMYQQQISQAELARRINVTETTLSRTLRLTTLHAALLWKIGQALHCNFFALLAFEFPVPHPSVYEQQLEQQLVSLQAALADMQKENQLYQKVLGK